MQDLICTAIKERRLLQFWYEGEVRVVEPHMLAFNSRNHLCLSAWWVGGFSKSNKSPHWREYLVADISEAELSPHIFDGPRPGYKADGGIVFHDIICALIA